ncbi:E2 domain-containing protein [Bradyrhizobium ganzhouense]|uniref:E2 domain-containing protein n=1 Tax=Bradyrhizobium ganzhouense TaxID=1179767 RepID=UPI003CEC8312
MPPDPLDIIKQISATHHAQPIEFHGDHAIIDVAPPTVSGAPGPTYRLRIEQVGTTAIAREAEPALLPACCPERHINRDGSFCLYWHEVEELAITDEEGGSLWMGKLLTFLRRQRIAASQRRWPAKSEARAHGAPAARQQSIAERAASDLGEKFKKLLDASRLTTVRKSVGGERRIRLMQDGRRLVTVAENGPRLMTKRARCKCDAAARLRLPISGCSGHEAALTDLTLALHRWEREEAKFYAAHTAKGTKCCGTMDDCPLRTEAA